MNPSGPVLRDIHLPPMPGWWPPAPGWWLLAAVVLILAAVLIFRLRKALRKRALLNAVQRELDAIEARAGQPQAAGEVSVLLRRMALRVSPAAAALQGEAWLAWLDVDGLEPDFSQGAGRCLLELPYQDRCAPEAVRTLLALSRQRLPHWLERTHV